MNARDQIKILNAGFRIIRKRNYPEMNSINLKIVQKTKNRHEWHDLEKNFPSLASRNRRIKELLQDQMTVEN